MVELNELRQFAAFAEQGTLSAAAEYLHLSQPALSRNMKKLEEDFGIPLFERTKNKLDLNENGKYVLELAKTLLSEADSLIIKAREFDRRNRTLMLGACSLGPVWMLTPIISNVYDVSLQTEQDKESRLLQDLDNNVYQLIATHIEPHDKKYYYKAFGQEHLYFAFPPGHKFAQRKSLTFAEMNGENMLLMPDIGFWSFVRDKTMPDSRFLTQSNRYNFNELLQASSLPSFTTNIVQKYFGPSPGNRVTVPISDPEATVTYYLVCKAERKRDFAALFRALS